MKFLSNQVFSSLAIYLLFTTLAIATPTTKQSIKASSQLILLSQNFRNFCKQNESVFVLAETKGFWINICGGDNPHTYIGVSKKDGSRIRLKLISYDSQGNYFEAINGDVNYTLIRKTTKGDFLLVTKGHREILKQPILGWE